ncbi:MAG: hypothetical protein AAB316_15840, partial [Bacteroidota bacterium]
AEKYNSLHSPDFIRGNGGKRPSISNLETYAARNREGMKRGKDGGFKTTIAFRFTERIADAERASERGIYHYVSDNGKDHFEGYGKFHVIERRENGKWKILVDYDSNEGATIGKDDWDAAFAPDDWNVLNPQRIADLEALQNINKTYVQAWLKSDEKGVLELFEEGARISPSGLCPIDSLLKISQFWFPKDGSTTTIHRFENEILTSSISGDLGFTTQKTLLDWSYVKGETKMGRVQEGIATTVFRRQPGGGWKIWRQMWTDLSSKAK